jgi:hypothetical protein
MGSISGKCGQFMAFIDTVVIRGRRLQAVIEVFTSMVKK